MKKLLGFLPAIVGGLFLALPVLASMNEIDSDDDAYNMIVAEENDAIRTNLITTAELNEELNYENLAQGEQQASPAEQIKTMAKQYLEDLVKDNSENITKSNAPKNKQPPTFDAEAYKKLVNSLSFDDNATVKTEVINLLENKIGYGENGAAQVKPWKVLIEPFENAQEQFSLLDELRSVGSSTWHALRESNAAAYCTAACCTAMCVVAGLGAIALVFVPIMYMRHFLYEPYGPLPDGAYIQAVRQIWQDRQDLPVVGAQ